MTADRETLAVYGARVADYAETVETGAKDPILRAFIAALPARAKVLDLGCGPGASAAAMRDAGLRVTASDASAEMVALAAERHGIAARCETFADLSDAAAFDAVWASFSLLHAPKAEFPGLLSRIRRALRPGGRFELGMKTGTGEGRDGLGRFYAYYDRDELTGLLQSAGFTVIDTQAGTGQGLAGTDEPWIWIASHA